MSRNARVISISLSETFLFTYLDYYSIFVYHMPSREIYY